MRTHLPILSSLLFVIRSLGGRKSAIISKLPLLRLSFGLKCVLKILRRRSFPNFQAARCVRSGLPRFCLLEYSCSFSSTGLHFQCHSSLPGHYPIDSWAWDRGFDTILWYQRQQKYLRHVNLVMFNGPLHCSRGVRPRLSTPTPKAGHPYTFVKLLSMMWLATEHLANVGQVAAYHNNLSLCRLLVDLGAAANALTSLGA